MTTHNDSLDRRSFLTRSTALLAGIPLVSSRTAHASDAVRFFSSGDTLHLYCDESGVLGLDPVFVLGMVVTTNSGRHQSFIARARLEHSFATQLRYSSTDRFKGPFAQDLISYFFEEPDLQFWAYVVTDETVQRLRDSGYSLEQVYHFYYETFLSNCTSSDMPKTLNLEVRNSIGDDRALRHHLRENVVNLSGINVLGSSSSDLLQVADLFTGCIYGDVHWDSLRSAVKLEILNALHARLNVDSLLDVRLESPRSSFRVFVL